VCVVSQGVENIYTQHKPQLHDVLDQLLKGKLREAAFPYIGNTQLRDRSDTNCSFLLYFFSQSHCYTQYDRLCVIPSVNKPPNKWSNREPVALCTLGLGLLNPASFRGR